MKKVSLDAILNPKSLALIGVSSGSDDVSPSKQSLAQRFTRAIYTFGFTGKIYPVHPGGGEFMGLKIYHDLKEVPGEVDLVISIIPARLTIQLMKDCIAKGVKAVHLFTSGYGEIEDTIGKQMESEILEIVRGSSTRIIGPNCMGIYNPSARLTFAADYPEQRGFPAAPGSLGMISQSGGNAIFCIRELTTRGVFFSKAISYGNAADLNESDFLEYFVNDPETKLIAMYVEGVRDGKRFFDILRKITRIKPVIIYKGGLTEAGERACASHTSAISGSARTWQGLIKQTGAVSVSNLDELVDVSVVLSKMARPGGRNTVLFGSGGGIGVQAADECTEAGLTLPLLPGKTRAKLNEIFGSEAGSIFRNPIDAPLFVSKEKLGDAIKCIADSENVDALIMHIPFEWAMAYRNDLIGPYTDAVVEVSQRTDKPTVFALHGAASITAKLLAARVQEKLVNTGLPVFASIKRAAVAISKGIDYYEWLDRQ